jgi:hypothetical protein
LVVRGEPGVGKTVLHHAGRLPDPRHDALRTVFGLSTGPPPDRFLLGLAVLSLLSEAAGKQLTVQEARVAQLARDGLSNPGIGATPSGTA